MGAPEMIPVAGSKTRPSGRRLALNEIGLPTSRLLAVMV
jgi:hypothetical protein